MWRGCVSDVMFTKSSSFQSAFLEVYDFNVDWIWKKVNIENSFIIGVSNFQFSHTPRDQPFHIRWGEQLKIVTGYLIVRAWKLNCRVLNYSNSENQAAENPEIRKLIPKIKGRTTAKLIFQVWTICLALVVLPIPHDESWIVTTSSAVCSGSI